MDPIAILSPHEIHRPVRAERLNDLIMAFLAEKERICTERTMVNYVNDLRPFLDWWQDHAADYNHTLTVQTFQDFITWLDAVYRNPFDKQSTSYTKWRVTKRIRHALRWAFEQGIVNAQIYDLCPQFPDTGRLKYYPDLDDLAAMLDGCTGEMRLRDAALIAFATSTGARRFEIANARAENLTFDSALSCMDIGQNHGGHVRFVKVKGDREGKGFGRISAFGSPCGLLVKAYLRSVDRRNGSLFGLSDQGIRAIVTRLGVQCGVTDMHPHAFRSALIDYWADFHKDRSYMATVAMKLQVGHALDKKDVSMHYIDTRNERKVIKLLRHFHVCPLQAIEWKWERWPVHVTPVDKAGGE